MKPAMLIPLLMLCGATVVNAETYKWTDARGVVSYTDNPALIPARYRSKALSGAENAKRNIKVQKKKRDQEEKILQDELTEPQVVTTVDDGQSSPAPPSMKQPIPAPLGDQPRAASPGMKQPVPAAPGNQPAETPLGMKQPIPAPLGDQPTETPAGMKQPIPAR